MADSDIAISRGRIAGPVALLVGMALVFVATGYAIGLFETLGYENRRVTFSGLASGTRSGGGFGLKTMVFFEGQTFFAEYDAEVHEGALRIGILETFGPIGDKPHFVRSIDASGSGVMTYRIPKTSLYSIYFDGSVLGADREARGYDVGYTVRWGAR